jgi:glutamine synthetase
MVRPVATKQYLALRDDPQCKAVGQFRKELASALNNLEGAIDGLRKALATRKNLIEAMVPLRKAVDTLEGIVDDDLWPMPKYREMLFIC